MIPMQRQVQRQLTHLRRGIGRGGEEVKLFEQNVDGHGRAFLGG